MLFACGVGTGVFFYGVAEPIYHYIGPNRYTADHALPDNELAQNAILITFFHWGLHAWGIYTIVGLLLGLMAHRSYLFSYSKVMPIFPHFRWLKCEKLCERLNNMFMYISSYRKQLPLTMKSCFYPLIGDKVS